MIRFGKLICLHFQKSLNSMDSFQSRIKNPKFWKFKVTHRNSRYSWFLVRCCDIVSSSPFKISSKNSLYFDHERNTLNVSKLQSIEERKKPSRTYQPPCLSPYFFTNAQGVRWRAMLIYYLFPIVIENELGGILVSARWPFVSYRQWNV